MWMKRYVKKEKLEAGDNHKKYFLHLLAIKEIGQKI
jgi:hypothetical protein